ncbi:MAG: nucleotide exchange factor GrpE [Clostridiales bacterium]|nr:nucleotide exchange factor GrpE [Clostridiales bacterium]
MGKSEKEKKDGINEAEREDIENCSNDCANDCTCHDILDEEVQLDEQFEIIKKERDANLALAQRIQAEFDNFRKRNKNISGEYYDMGVGELAIEFLAVLDNLERALESMDGGECPQAFVEGIDMVTKQFIDVFKKFEIEEIEAINMPFDPNWHHAVAQEPAEGDQEKNTVVEVLQKGYRHKDKVLRYSMVKVAK